MSEVSMLDATDRKIINALQGGFPVTSRPYAEAADTIGIGEQELVSRLEQLRNNGTITRFGPMFDAEAMGGAFCLCAMAVPQNRFEEVVDRVNAFPEVAHNYQRRHALNVWFVLACEERERIDAVISEIEAETGLEVVALPKLHEFFIGLRVEV